MEEQGSVSWYESVVRWKDSSTLPSPQLPPIASQLPQKRPPGYSWLLKLNEAPPRSRAAPATTTTTKGVLEQMELEEEEEAPRGIAVEAGSLDSSLRTNSPEPRSPPPSLHKSQGEEEDTLLSLAKFLASEHPTRLKLKLVEEFLKQDSDANPQEEAKGKGSLSPQQGLDFCKNPTLPPRLPSDTSNLWEVRILCQELLAEKRLSYGQDEHKNNDYWAGFFDPWADLEANNLGLTYADWVRLQQAYERGVTSYALLNSLAKLLGPEEDSSRDAHLGILSSYLIDPRPPTTLKVACLECLDLPKAALDLITKRDCEIEGFLGEKDYVLAWELRAVSLYHRDKPDHQILEAATLLADNITGTASSFDAVLTQVINLVNNSLIQAADSVVHKDKQVPASQEASDVVALTYSGTARRVSDQARASTEVSIKQIRDVSTYHVRKLSNRYGPQPASWQAVTHLALATIGATAVVGETIFGNTGALAKGITEAVGTVVEDRYGNTAGQVIRDIGATTLNVFRTVSHLSMLTGRSALTGAVVNNTGKVYVQDHQLQHEEEKIESVEASNVRTDVARKSFRKVSRKASFESYLEL